MNIKGRFISGVALFALSINAFAGSNLSAAPVAVSQPKTVAVSQFTTEASFHRGNAAYRSGYTRARARRSSKTKTVLRIAAPAAIGAGIGALAGGKKGAGVGALLGGGGGAIYHLYKTRRR